MILVWFTVIGALGLTEVLKDPAVIQGLSPSWAVRFMIDHGAAGYLVLGGVVLAVTGAEGHRLAVRTNGSRRLPIRHAPDETLLRVGFH